MCSFASSIVSLYVHEKALFMSVGEFTMGFSKRGQVPSHASLCEHCSPLSLVCEGSRASLERCSHPLLPRPFLSLMQREDLSTKGIGRG